MTIVEAIKAVMTARDAPMTAREAYNEIVAQGLYEFLAQNPEHVVLTAIRRHCVGLDFPTAGRTKHFQLHDDNRFVPLDQPKQLPRRSRKAKRPKSVTSGKHQSLSASLREIQGLHEQYISQLKTRVINDLRRLSPSAFETFAKELLEVYGFEDT